MKKLTFLFSVIIVCIAPASIQSVEVDLPSDDRQDLKWLMKMLEDKAVAKELELSARQLNEFREAKNEYMTSLRDLQKSLKPASNREIVAKNRITMRQISTLYTKTYQQIRKGLLSAQARRLAQLMNQQQFRKEGRVTRLDYLLSRDAIKILNVGKKTEAILVKQQKQCEDELSKAKKELNAKIAAILGQFEKDFRNSLNANEQKNYSENFGATISFPRTQSNR